ncbi:hypothetical protein H5410_063418 [Solanum commersonii]|uniref:Uncharacterized protein n=1 Tax=Solanum commersonii TaxID=4109 RepID=A0A9J5WEF4_SOLCO|nr:hypothetical protein H5410_063418 [Solanum commersonii]
MSLFGLGRNQRTFRPKKSAPSGSKGAQLRQHIDSTLGSGNLREAVRLPPGEDINEWLAVNSTSPLSLFPLVYAYIMMGIHWHVNITSISAADMIGMRLPDSVNLLYGTLTEFCTPENCPTMTAGPKYEYRWADGVQIKKPIEVSAPKYVEYLMDWIETQLDDESLFPQRLGAPFPPNFKDVVKTIFKRLFRVYAHIYHSHFQKIVSLKEEAHLNTCFKHFILFTHTWSLHMSTVYRLNLGVAERGNGRCHKEFGLIDKKELAPLQDLIDSIIVPY